MVQPQLVPGRALMGPSLGLVDGVSLSPPEGKCPADACSPGMRPAEGLLQGRVLLKLFLTSRAVQLHRITPAVPSQRFCYATCWAQHGAARRVCHRSSPASWKFSTGLLQNQRQHLLPGIPTWQGGKTVLELLQPSD